MGASVANVIPATYNPGMNRCWNLFAIVGLLVSITPEARSAGSNKKKDILTVRIHGEASPEDGDKFATPVTLLDGRKTSLSIMPLLNEHDIKSVYPFKTPDGSGGAYLRLDPHGANLLALYSIAKKGRGNVLAVMVNGRQVSDLVVDKAVNDGIFVIPSGLTMTEEARLVNAYPVTGQENNPDQKKKKQPFSPVNIMLPPKASDLPSSPAQ
jgi:hypothetical protein